MVRKIIYLFCILIFCIDFSNAQDKLYFFYPKNDSTLIGVKNDKGKIIIPANYPHFGNVGNNEIINTPTIEFYFSKRDTTNKKNQDHSVAISMGAVYNRDGKLLYLPLFYDNGPDYWSNGIRRYVENGKVGLVDSTGNKLTKAKWDMVWPFDEDNQAQVFIGNLKQDYRNGRDFPTITGSAITYFINTRGKRISSKKSIKFERVGPHLVKPKDKKI